MHYQIQKDIQAYMETEAIRPSEMARRLGITRQTLHHFMSREGRIVALEITEAFRKMEIHEIATEEMSPPEDYILGKEDEAWA